MAEASVVMVMMAVKNRDLGNGVAVRILRACACAASGELGWDSWCVNVLRLCAHSAVGTPVLAR